MPHQPPPLFLCCSPTQPVRATTCTPAVLCRCCRNNCRALFFTDLLACMTTIVGGATAYTRLAAQVAAPSSGGWTFFLQSGFRFYLIQAVIVTNIAGVLLMLSCMAQRTHTYQRYRLQLAASNRVLRLTLMLLVTTSPSVLGHMGLGILERTLSVPQDRSLALMLLHPVVFWLQQSLYVLPGRPTVLLQLLTTVLAMQWSKMLPCVLQHAAAQPSTDASPLIAAAESWCTHAQSWVSAALAAVVGPGSDPLWAAEAAACSGMSALQTLNNFCTLCILVLLPVSAAFSFDVWLWSVHHARNQSSSSTRHAPDSDFTTQQTPHVFAQAFASVDLQALATSAAAKSGVCSYYLFLLSPVVLGLTYLVAECMTREFAASTSCPAVLQSAGLL